MAKLEKLDHMTFESLSSLRDFDPSWRLLTSMNSAFVVSFLYQEFIEHNRNEIPSSMIVSHLESYIEDIDSFKDNSKTAQEYLTEWADETHGWLRRYYKYGSDEIHYDLTSSSQKAIEWLMNLRQNSFVGAESRLILIFELFNQLTEQTQEDPEKRLADLERQKAEIEEEIERTKKGNIKVLEPTQVKERFLQAMSMSREINADFRSVEQNFRDLNRNIREKIVSWDKSKSELIEDYFENANTINNSEQGKSFSAFLKFLNSNSAIAEFEDTINYLMELEPIKDIVKTSGIDELKKDWLAGGMHIFDMITVMSEQLSRYVNESYIDDDRVITQIIKNIEANATKYKVNFQKETF